MRVRWSVRIIGAAVVLAAAVGVVKYSSDSGDHSRDAHRYFTFTSATDDGKVIAPRSRAEIRDYTGGLLSGGHLDVRSLRSRIVVLNFWASWCGPCRAETPQFDLLSRAVHDNGIDFVGIDFKDTADDAREFVAQNHISYPIVTDPEGTAELRFGNVPAQGPPFTILLDRHQRVAAVYFGPQSDADLRHAFGVLEREH